MKLNNKTKGISLIVLIITIAVIIVLTTITLVTVANNRPIESAKNATNLHNEAALMESAKVLSAQWKLDKLIDSSIGTRNEYVKNGLKAQGFTDEEMESIVIDEDTGELGVK